MRIKTGNDKCPFCNAICNIVILTDKQDSTFESFDLKKIIEQQGGIFFENKAIQAQVEEYNMLKCPVIKCSDTTAYHGMQVLRRHLKDVHKRFYCDICLEHRTLTFKEQKLFTNAQLERHMKYGDVDDEKNVIFFHPYCKFCDRYFYDEDMIIKHIREDHYKCDLCDVDRKYFFFNKYENLERHYNMSHYLCQEELCRKSHVVFRTSYELEHHMLKTHYDKTPAGKNAIKNQNLLGMANFDFSTDDDRMKKKIQKTFIKDTEGVDFEPQLLSMRKLKTYFFIHHQVSGEEKLDIRRYFPKNQLYELVLDHSDLPQPQQQNKDVEPVEENNERDRGDDQGSSNYKGYKGRKNNKRGGYGGGNNRESDQQSMYVAKNAKPVSKEFYLEDCNMANYAKLDITKEEFYDALKPILSDQDIPALKYKATDYFKGKSSIGQLFESWKGILGERLLFKAFPFLIATVEREDTAKEMDDHLYKKMLELPKQKKWFIYEISTFGELFKRLHAFCQKNVISRILEDKINYKEKLYTMDPSRVFQLIQIIKRLGNQDMASFKFAMNFGLTQKTKDTLIHQVILNDPSQADEHFSQVDETEIFILLKYLEICRDKLSNKLEAQNLNMISKNLLDETFKNYKDVAEKFSTKVSKEDLKELKKANYVERKGSYELSSNNILDRELNKNTREKVEEQKVGDVKVDAKDKFEFPDLEKIKAQALEAEARILPLPSKTKSQKLKDHSDGRGGWNKQNPYLYKPAIDGAGEAANIRKKIEEDFPTLMPAASQSQTGGFWDKLSEPNKKKTPEFEYLKNADNNKKKEEEYYDDEYYEEAPVVDDKNAIELVAQSKGKKNKKKTFLQGGFK